MHLYIYIYIHIYLTSYTYVYIFKIKKKTTAIYHCLKQQKRVFLKPTFFLGGFVKQLSQDWFSSIRCLLKVPGTSDFSPWVSRVVFPRVKNN